MSVILDFFSPSDSVIRTAYYKYFHPKEALISNGVLNRYITGLMHKGPPKTLGGPLYMVRVGVCGMH